MSDKKKSKLPYSEADLIEKITPEKAHADDLPDLLPDEIENACDKLRDSVKRYQSPTEPIAVDDWEEVPPTKK